MKSYEFWEEVSRLTQRGLRKGQAVYVVAHSIFGFRECFAVSLRAGDPFYNDSCADAFVAELPFKEIK